MEKELETLSYNLSAGQVLEYHQSSVLSEADVDDVAGKHIPEKASKKKKGKPTGSAKTVMNESDPASQENITARSKKNQRKSKEAAPVAASVAKTGSIRAAGKVEENQNIPSEEWVMQRIMSLAPDLEEIGGLFLLVCQLT